jgi:hypothetical protein
MAETIIDSTNLNETLISYSSPKANPSGGKSINIMNKPSKSILRLSTPLMLTWGIQEYIDKQTGVGTGKFDLALQFPSEDYRTEDTDKSLDGFKRLEAKVKSDALTNSKEWFGKAHKTTEVIDALYNPMLRYGKDKITNEPDYNRAPTLNIKIPKWEDAWRVLICDEDGEKLYPSPTPGVTPLDFIKKSSMVALIIQSGGIWFVNGKFSITWKLVQAVVKKPKPSLLSECYIKLKPAEKDKIKESAATNADDDDDVPITIVDDSDDDIAPPVQALVLAPAPVQEEPRPETDDVPEQSATVEVVAAVTEKKVMKKILKKPTK